ncbi:MAG: RNA-binding transcriptional accessory protein [Proteobacteria bacterium]|nr:RNA-binding transcriptional accessory protein [Pseudomonadota bacterium]
MFTIEERIAQELCVSPNQINAAVKLLDEGATVPFIARYRKEATQGLDDTQLRSLQERLLYLRELEERRETILNSIQEQNKLNPELKAQILQAQTKIQLEDLYRPYKPKRRTKGQIAIEAGLKPLSEALWQDPTLNPATIAEQYIDNEKGVPDIKTALEGARYILMEQFAEDASLLGKIRTYLQENCLLQSKVNPEKAEIAQKFQDYFAHQELWKKVPSHRCLAMLRGRKEGFLQLALILPEEIENPDSSPIIGMIAQHLDFKNQGRNADSFLQDVIKATWRIKIQPHLETELIGILKENAEEEAIVVFKRNLHDLLMAPPAGHMATLGLDPGLRTGVKVAIVDPFGKLLATDTLYPHPPHKQWQEAIEALKKHIEQHNVKLVSIGNGTASRETEKLVDTLMQQYTSLKLTKVITSEAGASVYSASEFASKEFPNLDVSLRGAVSIARRLQDPLAELVKIEPKSIGVGQYQHDVNQAKLSRTLDAIVEDAVNAVGVDVNTASHPLLTHVAGLNQQIAQNIIEYREQHGPFQNRPQLKKVPRLGEKAFEQAAGFLRIVNGDNPLDASCVHPEAYPVVETILAKSKLNIEKLIGNSSFIQHLNPKEFITDKFGLPTIKDIFKELEKPGRDPRASFQTAQFKEGIESISDLKEGMVLEGVVTNVANFGAFVDIGVHQDGLVHISALSHEFVKEPSTVVKTGQIVKVKVLEIDIPRKRISLSMRLDAPSQPQKTKAPNPSFNKKPKKETVAQTSSLGLALQKALKDKDGH